MVPNPGTKARPAHLRPLNTPIPVTVTTERHRPSTLVIDRHTHLVERVQDTWIIADEWWRQPIERQYFTLLLEDGTGRTVYHDRVTDAWYLQDY